MKEYKGTKERWSFLNGHNFAVTIKIGKLEFEIDRLTKSSREILCSKEELYANAQLIAAAPNLLKELIRLVEKIEAYAKDTYMEEIPETWDAKEAINKALGEKL